jgi:hypothetical protein
MRFVTKEVLLVLTTLLSLGAADAVGSSRTVTGRVLSSDGETLAGAVVQIKNVRTLQVRSFISQKDGGYHFVRLATDVDHEIFARYRGRFSPKKNVSQFDSSEVVQVDLVIPNE